MADLTRKVIDETVHHAAETTAEGYCEASPLIRRFRGQDVDDSIISCQEGAREFKRRVQEKVASRARIGTDPGAVVREAHEGVPLSILQPMVAVVLDELFTWCKDTEVPPACHHGADHAESLVHETLFTEEG